MRASALQLLSGPGAHLLAMSSVPAFISELIRAANEVEKLIPNEIGRLLERSVDTIRDMREQAGRFGSRRARDVLIEAGQE
ncbi:hydroxymethylpyrimidine/phosphomethylpyrimidine kinase [Sinorhizobium sp. Sb3]|uniref:hydroxymethylpyrimidine/phosphomethylpyrimidine kinase n=1 Tax=Sinorhizobium/Ensifer group TaxID=227292 RepID=UPI001FDA6774|nr:hydroxymethylpyrimidine/phosphomethylpyrimidine kinase [Sinorhizobium sp. Sb3]